MTDKKVETKEVASVQRDPLNTNFMGVMSSKDPILKTKGGGKGLDVYDEVERDPKVYSVLQKRKLAVIAREWVVDPASEDAKDIEAAEFIEQQFADRKLEQWCLDLMDAHLKGFAVSEIMWGRNESGQVIVDAIKSRNPNRFVFDEEAKLRLLTKGDPVKGEELPQDKFIIHTFGGKYGNPYGVGLGSMLYWPVFFKKSGIKFWLIFSEKFGAPTAVGKYNSGTSDKEKQTLLQALGSINSDTAIIIPEDMEISFIEAARTGSVDTYKSLCEFMDKQISLCVLGETLTSDVGDAGSKAAGQVHNDVRLEFVKADADLLSEVINNQLIKPLMQYNFPDAGLPKFWRDVSEPEDLNALAERDLKLKQLGLEPEEDYVVSKYSGWKRPEKPVTPHAAQPENFSEESKVPNIDALMDQFEDISAASLDDMIGAIKDMVDKAESLEALQEQLLDVFKDMDETVIAELLSDALALSDLTGRSDLKAEGE